MFDPVIINIQHDCGGKNVCWLGESLYDTKITELQHSLRKEMKLCTI